MISLYKIQKKTKWSEENHETIESGNLKADAVIRGYIPISL